MSTSTGPTLSFNLKLKQSSSSICTVKALLKQSAFPDMNIFKNNDDYVICQSNSTKNCSLSVDYPLDNAWYFLGITSECNYSIEVAFSNNCVESPFSISNETLSTLMESTFPGVLKQKTYEFCRKLFQPIETFRFIGPTYFSVKYYFNSNHNRSNALLIRNEKKPYFIEFLVDQANNGGTLNFYLVNNLINDPTFYESDFLIKKASLLPNEKYSKNSTSNNKASNLGEIKVMLYACLLFNSMNKYKNCPEGFLLSTQSFTNIFSNFQLNVAYPFMGKWYLAVWKECFNINTK